MRNYTTMLLRECRKARQLTQVQLSKRADVLQTAISDIETGRIGNPSWRIVGKLSRALDIDPFTLFPITESSSVA